MKGPAALYAFLRHANHGETESHRSVLRRAIDIRVGHRLRFRKRFRFSHQEPFLEERVFVVVVDITEILAPVFCELALNIEKLTFVPAVERLLFR